MSSTVDHIQELKRQKRATILAHVYTPLAVQNVADYVGDSLGLSREAAQTKSDIIVFAGVYFMAETAAILCPDKKVLIPDAKAGCPMADMADVGEVQDLKQEYPHAAVVCYVNSTAEVKAESDICVTSANAVDIVRRLPQKQIIFIPDKSLGAYVQQLVPEKELILWPGFCPTHHRILLEFLLRAQSNHPLALTLAHPENTQNILNKADFIGSTGQIQKFVAKSMEIEFIIASENGLVERLAADNPHKRFYSVTPLATCPNMKKNTLEKILAALRDEVPVVTVAEPIRSQAKRAIDKMLEFSN
jgi:quinolinate synthase